MPSEKRPARRFRVAVRLLWALGVIESYEPAALKALKEATSERP
jgi:hypothetical protein